MKKPDFKFFILRRLAHLLRSWANLASKLSGMGDNSENVDFSVSHASFSAVTEGLSIPVKDGESAEKDGPPAHWLARIEAARQPANWLSHVSANRPATQKSQERQNLQEPQPQKEYQENRTLSRSIPIIPPDDRERTTSHSVQVTVNTLTEEDVNRQATPDSENSAVKHITMNRPAPLTESNIRQIWGQRAVFAPLSQLSTPAPREWPSSSTKSDPSPWQEKVALPAIPKIEQNPRLQDQKSEQTILSSRSLPENITPNTDQDRIVEQPDNRESAILQELAILDGNVHRWPQQRMPERVDQLDQPSLPPVASLMSQVVKMDSPSQEARFDRHTTFAGEPVLWAQILPAESVFLPQSGNQTGIPPQMTMHWPSLPEDSTLNMTSDSQDLTLMRRRWERQQRLNEEQRGNLWNA